VNEEALARRGLSRQKQTSVTEIKFIKLFFLISVALIYFNPFQSNFSANRILPSSYLFWAVKSLVDYL
jgi:hypothetical protein